MPEKKTFSIKTLTLYFLMILGTAALLVFLSSRFSYLLYPERKYSVSKPSPTPTPNVDKTMTLEEVKKYNGSDPNLPIYMVYGGYVYDVTAGKNFYAKGHAYNYLTGKDSTKELDFVGLGNLIKSKYPLVAKIVN